jgi:hypothetical protein
MKMFKWWQTMLLTTWESKTYCLWNSHTYFGLLVVVTQSTWYCKELAAYKVQEGAWTGKSLHHLCLYGHTRSLDCTRHFTYWREIIRPGVTRFASSFFTLTNILEKKDQLRKMVVDSKCDTLRDVKSKKEYDATRTMMNPTFWKNVMMCLSVF